MTSNEDPRETPPVEHCPVCGTEALPADSPCCTPCLEQATSEAHCPHCHEVVQELVELRLEVRRLEQELDRLRQSVSEFSTNHEVALEEVKQQWKVERSMAAND